MSAVHAPTFGTAVIGAGMGGLTCAALLAKAGESCILLESHDKPGGCAGYFTRQLPVGSARFDVGATALMALEPAEWLGRLLARLGCQVPAQRVGNFPLHLPDRTVNVCALHDMTRQLDVPPHAAARFWTCCENLARIAWPVAERLPPLPPRSLQDLVHIARAAGFGSVRAAWAACIPLQTLLRAFGLHRSTAFCAAIDMLLADTTQTDRFHSPAFNAAVCLDVYRRGLYRPFGGMGILADQLARAAHRHGCALHYRSRVLRITRNRGGWLLETATGQRIRASRLVSNLPYRALRAILHIGPNPPPPAAPSRTNEQSVDTWGAATIYALVHEQHLPTDAPPFAQVLQNYPAPRARAHFGEEGENLLISLSLPGDLSMAPRGHRTITISTHTRLDRWRQLPHQQHLLEKQQITGKLLAGLARAFPHAAHNLIHCETGTPRSWRRYTRRLAGGVGGTAVTLRTANLLSQSSRPLPAQPLWIVGDSVFPGQGTLACCMSGARAARQILAAAADAQHRPRPAAPSAMPHAAIV